MMNIINKTEDNKPKSPFKWNPIPSVDSAL